MRGSYVARWLTVFTLVWSAPVWGQNAHQDGKKVSFEELKVNPVKIEALRVTIDYSEVPQHKEWAEKAKTLVEAWHPKIDELLKSEGFAAPREVKIVFKNQKTIAFANPQSKTISISSDWITKNPNDFGMVAHELTHIIQSYRGTPKGAGWIVEGIADYVRHYAYEPDAKMRTINVKKAKYTDAYQTAAQFLRWVEKKYDKEIVFKLNRALREREYNVAIFQKSTGKNVDDLWAEFIETLSKD